MGCTISAGYIIIFCFCKGTKQQLSKGVNGNNVATLSTRLTKWRRIGIGMPFEYLKRNFIKILNPKNDRTMTLVKFKNGNAYPSFNSLVDDLFLNMPSLFKDVSGTGPLDNFAPVNVKETENGYDLELVAPGLNKEDFKIDLDKNMLTVSYEKKSENEEKTEKYLRREYKNQSFKRSFTVDENIDAERISAKYVNGILTLNLPKKEEVNIQAKQITID
jgi:HSP20 family protein